MHLSISSQGSITVIFMNPLMKESYTQVNFPSGVNNHRSPKPSFSLNALSWQEGSYSHEYPATGWYPSFELNSLMRGDHTRCLQLGVDKHHLHSTRSQGFIPIYIYRWGLITISFVELAHERGHGPCVWVHGVCVCPFLHLWRDSFIWVPRLIHM